MSLIRTITISTFLLTSIGASGESALKINPTSVGGLSCGQSTSQLKLRIELYAQLADAYLQSTRTLEAVYRTFGEKLEKAAGPQEIAEIARHFKSSADSLVEANTANARTLADLRIETELLATHIGAECVHPAR